MAQGDLIFAFGNRLLPRYYINRVSQTDSGIERVVGLLLRLVPYLIVISFVISCGCTADTKDETRNGLPVKQLVVKLDC